MLGHFKSMYKCSDIPYMNKAFYFALIVFIPFKKSSYNCGIRLAQIYTFATAERAGDAASLREHAPFIQLTAPLSLTVLSLAPSLALSHSASSLRRRFSFRRHIDSTAATIFNGRQRPGILSLCPGSSSAFSKLPCASSRRHPGLASSMLVR